MTDLNTGPIRSIRCSSDAIVVVMTPDDARWLYEEMCVQEQVAITGVAHNRRACDAELLAQVQSLKSQLEDELGIDTKVRRGFVPVEER